MPDDPGFGGWGICATLDGYGCGYSGPMANVYPYSGGGNTSGGGNPPPPKSAPPAKTLPERLACAELLESLEAEAKEEKED